MPVVMLLLILMPLTMAGELCMLCQCLFLGRGRVRRRLALLAGAVLLLLAVWLGGGALLETAGLGWRRWVSGGLVAAAAIAAAALALLLPRELHTLLPGAESLGQDLLLSDCAGAGGLSWAAVHAGAVEGSGQGVGGADRGGGVQRHFPGDWIPLCKLVRPRGAGLCVGGLRQWSGGGWSGPWRGRRRS